MSKEKIWLIIALMSVSLMGILSLQYYWIDSMIKTEEAKLDQEIYRALAQLEKSIEELEAMTFIKSADSSHESDTVFHSKSGNKFEYISKLSYEEDDSILEEIQEKYSFNTSGEMSRATVILEDGSSDVSVIRIDDSVKTRVNLIRRFNEKKHVLSAAIDQIAFDFAFEKSSFKERIEGISFDSLLSASLEKEGLKNLNLEYSLRSTKTDSLLRGVEFSKNSIDSKQYKRELLNEEKQGSGIIELRIHDQTIYLVKTLWPILAISVLLSIFMLFTFSYTLYSILRQKKLSQMKSDFINNMTHEFKTPIATISLAIDSMLHPDVLKKEMELKRFGKIIEKENKRMNQQVELLLQAAQFDKGKIQFEKKQVSVKKILLEIKNLYDQNPSENKAIQIDLELNAKNHIVIGDKMHLFNAFRNIVDNAIKFSKEKAEIQIQTENLNGKILVKISDKGIGMSKETQEHIFESFYRYTEGDLHETKGFGLGLAYVGDVIKKMDAKITVSSNLGEGSSFSLLFNNIEK